MLSLSNEFVVEPFNLAKVMVIGTL